MKKVLIIRTDAIGDFVLFSAIASYFRQIYPNHEIAYCGNKATEKIVNWFNVEQCNFFDRALWFDKNLLYSNAEYAQELCRYLAEFNPDIIINPAFSRETIGDMLALSCKDAYKIGYEGDYCNYPQHIKDSKSKEYDLIIKNSNVPLELESDRNKHFINQLAQRNICLAGIPEWKLTSCDRDETIKILKSFNINLVHPYIIVHPGAGNLFKMWPKENFFELIKTIKLKWPRFQIVVLGAAEREKEPCNYIERQFAERYHIKVHNLFGKISLVDALKIIGLSSLLIANDTSVVHIAAALKIQTVCIMGGAHFNRFYPYNKTGRIVYHEMDCFHCNWQCKYGKSSVVPCIKNISVEDVMEKVRKIL